MFSTSRFFVVALLGAVSLALPSAAAHAQEGGASLPSFREIPHVGLGWVASVPTTFAGVSALAVTPRLFGGLGLYADFKFSVSSPGNDSTFTSSITVDQAVFTYGDEEHNRVSTVLVGDLAVVLPLTDDFLVYGGAGYVRETRYREYFDASETRGTLGWYWVEDTAGSGERLNLLGGMFLRLGRNVLFQLGAEAVPKGGTVGLMLVLPR